MILKFNTFDIRKKTLRIYKLFHHKKHFKILKLYYIDDKIKLSTMKTMNS